MKLEYANHDFKEAKICLLGCPHDRTSSFLPGSRFGPEYIRLCTPNIEWFSPYQDRSVAEVKLCDLGDLDFVQAQPLKEIERAVRRIYERGKRVIILGGEHTVSFPVVRAIESLKGRFSVIHLDAHADLRSELGGDPLSHACAIRRVSEVVGIKNVFQFGIRSGTVEEFSLHKNLYRFEVYKPLKRILNRIKDPVYLTIDVDVLNPAEMPAVGTPEPGGISFRELIDSLLLFRGRKIIGADIVEYNPLAASPWASGSLAAVLLRELVLVM
jgi:agmatinase